MVDLSAGIFNIPSFSSRFYHYERNVPGRGMTRAVWGRGGSALLLLKLGPFSGRYLYRKSDMMDRSQEITLQCDIVY